MATAVAAPPALAAAAGASPDVAIANVLGKAAGPKLEEVFAVDRQLGKGSFGVVHLARNKTTDRPVAVKSLSKAKLVCKEDVDDIKGEVAILNLVGGHKHVVTLEDTFEDPANVYLVMELCEGGELFDSIVAAGSFSEKQAAAHFRRMVEVIKHCHELGVMHRDLKPENFLLTSKCEAAELKLADFGLSTFFKGGERFRELVGSPYYVAPEVLRKDYTQAADMWSLGVILYILLSGLPPFWGNNEEQIFGMVLKGKVDFDTDPWPRISAAAKDCVSRLLTMDPAKRTTANEILKHEWLAKEGVAPDEPLGNAVLDRMNHFAQMNKLKKMALMVVGQNLAPDELTGLKELFRSFDTDDNGTITIKEMKQALQSCGHKIKEDELASLLSVADVSGDGYIDYNEFVAATMHLSKLEKEELLVKAFKNLDKDGSGSISVDELSGALKQFGIYDDAAKLLDSADKDKDGTIDYQEFSWLLRTHNEDLQTSARAQARTMLSRFF